MKKNLLSLLVLLLFATYQLGAQCNPPAALDCESSPVLCSLDELDGYSCANPDIANPTGPSPLCFGTGVPHNTNWWAFVGNGDFINMVFEFDPTDCTGQGTGCSGIQVGILDDCGGDPLDCNANCNTSTLTLSGQTINCHTYYVWIDGCCGDVCNYTIDVGGGGPPMLPRPLPPPELVGRACPCGIAEVCVEDLAEECDAKKQWTVDGVDRPDFDDLNCLEFEIMENGAPVEICVTWTIGNPANPDAICDQESACFTLVPEDVEIIWDGEHFVCWEDHEGGGYEWRGDIIYVSCVNPPCKKREQGPDDCCVDYEAEITLLPPRPISEKYVFFCDKADLPLITEDGNAYFEEACGDEITWKDPDFHDCDTTYILYMSFFDPEVTLNQECGRCDGFVTLTSEVEYDPDCIQGDVTWVGYWLNDFLDTIGVGEFLEVNEEGTYTYVLHVTYIDAITGEVQECDLEGPWLITVLDFGIPAPELDGLSPICEAAIGDYEILNTYLDACEYNWYIKRGGGQIITQSYLDSTKIQVEWVNLIGGAGEVCVNVTSDCSESEETCFEVEFKDAPSPDAGPDAALCAKDWKMDGVIDVPGGAWTIIKSPGNVNIDMDDIKSDVSVDQYGEYVFVWTENILTCEGDDTVTIIFNSDPEHGPVDTICGGDADDYRIFFEIFQGTQPYTIVEGGGVIVNGNQYESDTILDNEIKRIVIEDKYGCEFIFDIDHDCVCPNEIGVVSQDLIEECGVTTVMIDYNPTNMVLGPDDVFEFVLYTEFGAIFTTDIEINKSGSFTFDPNTMNFGQTYYMGVVLGKNRGDEFVNRLGGCVKIAEGQPVVWYEIPTPDAGADFEVCASQVELAGIQSIAGSTIKWLTTAGAIISNPDQTNTVVTVTNFGRYVFKFTELNAICPGIDSVVILFHESPDITGLEKICIDQNLTYEWEYEAFVGKGQAPYILISGNGTLDAGTGKFSSNRLKSLVRDTVIVEDVNGCRDTLPVVHNCDCGLTAGGTMNTQIEQVCVDQCVTVVTNNDHGLENDDCVFMILHPDSSNVERGKIIDIQAFNPNGNEFCFDDARGMIINQVYFVSYVVGECDPNGDINLEDACFKIISKPVRFIPYPTPDPGQDKDICGLFTNLEAVPSLGTGSWSIVNTPAGGNAIFTSDLPGSNLSVDQYGTYTFRWTEDNGGCIENEDVTITFHDSPIWTNVIFECDDVAENYRMTFELSGGEQATWEAIAARGWDAISLGGNKYQTPWIETGGSVSITINDAWDCLPIKLDTSHVCECITEPGVLDLEPHIFCVDGIANTKYSGGVEDPNDVIIFYLHDGDVNSIGNTIIVQNKDGRFVFNPNTMVLNKVYYVTARVGNDDGNGGIVLTDRCIGQTPGVPVAWYEAPDPKIVSIEDQLTCIIDVIELDGTGSINRAGIGGLNYTWSTSNGAFETGAVLSNDKVNIVNPGKYTLTVINDITGCEEITTYDITIDRTPPIVDPGAPRLLTCDITSVQLDGSKSDNGSGYSISWKGPGINATNTADLNPIVTEPGNYILTVVNSETGCDNEAEVIVTSDYTKPVPDIVQVGDLTCATDQIVLDGAGSTSKNGIRSYAWGSTNGNIISGTSSDKITITSPGIYDLIVIDALTGCPDTIEIQVKEIDNTLELMQLESRELLCNGDRDATIDITSIIGGFPTYEYSFDGSAFSSKTHFSDLGPGTYRLKVRDKNGCEIDTTITIIEPEIVDIKANEDKFVVYDDDLDITKEWHDLTGTFDGEQGTVIYWEDENGDKIDPDLKNLRRSHYVYTVVVVNKNGCEARDLLNIYVKIERKVYIPNVFAPIEGQAKNNKVLVFGKPGIIEKVNVFRVYDRWGELVYENDEDIYFDDLGASLDGWNGDLNGSPMNPGVYVYYTEVEFKDLGDGIVIKKLYGDVTLLR